VDYRADFLNLRKELTKKLPLKDRRKKYYQQINPCPDYNRVSA
jgi:hypothetical protein